MRRRWAIRTLMLLVVMLTVSPLRGATYAVGDAKNLWLVTQESVPSKDNPVVAIQVRPENGPAAQLVKLGERFGRIKPRGVAAAEGRLWLIYTNGTVQSVTHRPDAPPMTLPYRDTIEQPLPVHNVQILGLAAYQRGLWLLVKTSDANDLAAIDRLNVEPQADDDDDADESTEAEPEDPKPTTNSKPQLRLLQLDQATWRKVDLPEAFITLAESPDCKNQWALARDPRGDVVSLIVAVGRMSHVDVTEFQYGKDQWQENNYALQTLAPLQAAAVERQIVLAYDALPAQSSPDQTDADKKQIQLVLLRADQVSPLASLDQTPDTGQPWTLVTDQARAAIVYLDESDQNAMRLQWVDLQGRITGPQAIEQQPVEPWRHSIDSLVLIAVIAVATLILFAFWRRDPNWNQMHLPAELAVADLGRRAAAGLIDLVPCILIAFYFQSVPLSDLQHHWPGQLNESWQDMIPGAIAIGLFVAYCTLAELFTATTLGKKIMGLKVAGLNGQPPNVWQVLARNFIKIFELIAFFLLLLPVLVPNHQRLGDLVGRTVVIGKAGQPREPKEPQEQNHDDDPWS